jgi:hypothetical protein
MREHGVVVSRGGGSWGEDVRGSAFSGCRKKVKKKNLTFFFRVVFECGGCHSGQW